MFKLINETRGCLEQILCIILYAKPITYYYIDFSKSWWIRCLTHLNIIHLLITLKLKKFTFGIFYFSNRLVTYREWQGGRKLLLTCCCLIWSSGYVSCKVNKIITWHHHRRVPSIGGLVTGYFYVQKWFC